MGRIVATRLALLPLVVIGVSAFLFVVGQIIPSDPVKLIVGDFVPPDVRAAIVAKYGLDQPLTTQYWNYLTRLIQGDLGMSIRYNLPVLDILLAAFPATVVLVTASAVVNVLLTFPLGFLAAKYRGTWIDATIRGFAIVGNSTASFILAIGCILFFGFYLNWLPISGRGSPPDFQHLILPAFVLGYHDAGNNMRIFRASLIHELGQDYVRAARARGIGEAAILLRHAGRNSLGPAITVLGLGIARIGGGVVLIETVFAWPGVGRIVQTGILWRDFPLVSGALMFLLSYTVVVTLIVDLLHRFIDPRVRT